MALHTALLGADQVFTTGLVLQAYLVDSPQHLDALLEFTRTHERASPLTMVTPLAARYVAVSLVSCLPYAVTLRVPTMPIAKSSSGSMDPR